MLHNSFGYVNRRWTYFSHRFYKFVFYSLPLHWVWCIFLLSRLLNFQCKMQFRVEKYCTEHDLVVDSNSVSLCCISVKIDNVISHTLYLNSDRIGIIVVVKIVEINFDINTQHVLNWFQFIHIQKILLNTSIFLTSSLIWNFTFSHYSYKNTNL